MTYKLGIPDEEFIRGKVPMTKQEVRILTIVKARLDEDSVVVDVGAGTGSISVEMALQAPKGMVYAIEKKNAALDLINKNCVKFGVENVEIIAAEAPGGMDRLPELDAAVIGGSGNYLEVILDIIDSKLKPGGRIVLNCITLQTLNTAMVYMKTHHAYSYEIIQVQVSRYSQIGRYDMAKAENPIFIVTCTKNEEDVDEDD